MTTLLQIYWWVHQSCHINLQGSLYSTTSLSLWPYILPSIRSFTSFL